MHWAPRVLPVFVTMALSNWSMLFAESWRAMGLKGHGAPIPSLWLQTSSPDPQASHFCSTSPCTGFEQGDRPGTHRGPFQPKLFSISVWIPERASAFISQHSTEARSGGRSVLSTLLCKVKEVLLWGCLFSAGSFSVGLAGPCSTVLLLHMQGTTAASHLGMCHKHIQASPTSSVLMDIAHSCSHQPAV